MKNKIILIKIYSNRKNNLSKEINDNSPEGKLFKNIVKATKDYDRREYLRNGKRRIFKRNK